jgi:hypothetical protein
VVDALEVLLARIPAQSVRLVVFNLQEGHEIFRQDGFRPDALEQVKEAFGSLGYHAVNVAELQTHPLMTSSKLLDSLVQRELHEAKPSDAVLFVGMEPPWGTTFRLSAPPPHPIPPVSYIHLLRPMAIRYLGPVPAWVLMRNSEMAPSTTLVSWAVRELHGNTTHAGYSKEFDQEIDKFWKSLQSVHH